MAEDIEYITKPEFDKLYDETFPEKNKSSNTPTPSPEEFYLNVTPDNITSLIKQAKLLALVDPTFSAVVEELELKQQQYQDKENKNPVDVKDINKSNSPQNPLQLEEILTAEHPKQPITQHQTPSSAKTTKSSHMKDDDDGR